MSENKLPESWVMTTLNSVGQIISGGTPSTSKSEYWGGEISWISPVDLSGYKDRYITKGGKSITELGLARSSAKLMPKGSVLFSSRAPIGYVAIANNQLCTNQGFKSIIPNTAIDNIYLYYFLKSAKKQAEELASGTTFKEISLTNFSSLHIPLPPLAEQHRIVAKIEELFSELDKAIETLKTAQQQLKVYRQAVLKYAFEGRLTNPDVKEGELPEGWEWISLGDASESMKNGIYKSADAYDETGIACLRMYNIEKGSILWYDVKRMILSPEEIDEYKLLKGDLLVNRVNSRELVGKTAYVKGFSEPVVYESKNIRVRLRNEFLGEYLNFWFLHRGNKYFTSNAQQTVGMASVNQKQLSEFTFPCPVNKKEQEKIVIEIHSRLSVCDKIEESIQQGLQQAETLRQSILKKAFEGKLVPQDPNDEPASELLARIKAERDASPEKKSRTRKAKP